MKILALTLLLAFVSIQAHAHGEDKPGPHGGFIRMPGAYHTEVVPKDNTVEVYLLDMDWKNPVVKDSSVEAEIRDPKAKKKTSAKAQCLPDKSFFLCTFAPGTNTKGPGRELVLTTTRAKQKGNKAVYELPFKLAAPTHNSAPDDPHAGH